MTGDILSFALRALFALVFIVGMIWVVSRKLGATKNATANGPSVQVLSRRSLSRHTGVAVIAVGERRLLVGMSDQQVTMLSELSPAEDLDGRGTVEVSAARRAALPEEHKGRTDVLSTISDDTGHIAIHALSGSILDANTWRKAMTLLRERTVRR